MATIVFCGGGTLGHFTPNIAIFEALKKKHICYYIGSKNGLEKEPATKLMPYYEIETVKLIRSFTLKNLLIPYKLLKGISEAKKILKKIKPDIIFSKGGFVSVPVVLAANKLKIPCITHESDFSIGLANKLIYPKCKYLLTSFEETSKGIPNGKYVGSPIRNIILNGNKYEVCKKLKLSTSKKTILIVGGSLGSENINSSIRKILPKLSSFNIIHLTGKNKMDNSINYNYYHQIEFANDIQNYYQLADLIITRGGSNTLFEILALKKTMLIIPLGTSQSRGDQILNAKEFYKKNYANILLEDNLNEETLYNSILETLKNSSKYIGSMKNIKLNATKEICTIINEVINSSK